MKYVTGHKLMGVGTEAQGSTITVSIYTVTSKTITVQWSRYAGASSYKVTATPRNSLEPSVFTHFSGNNIMGTVGSLSTNTPYTIQVEAMDDSMNVLSQTDVEGETSPEVPIIEAATSKQSQNMTVEFTEVQGATSYILRAVTADGSFFSETTVPGSPGTIEGLQPYTEYTLNVMSVNAGGRSQASLPVQAKTVVSAPQLTATSPNNDTIVLDWAPVDHAVLYTLSIIREGSDSQHRLNTTDTSISFQDLEAGTNYCITAKAWDPESNPGDDFTICQVTRPPTPQSIELTVTYSQEAGLSVSWAVAQGAEQYLAVSSRGLNCSSSSSPCVMTTLQCGERFSVSVTAVNQAGPSYPSDPLDFISFPCPPSPLWMEEAVPGNCSVSWNAVPWAERYTAFVKRDDGTEEMCNSTDTDCSFHCRCGYTFLMTVFAYNQAGASPPGTVLNYTTLPCCPDDVSISLVSTETLEIGWSSVRGAEVYETRAVDESEVILCNDTAPVCALSGLTCNSRYSVVVTPCNELRGCNRACQPQTHETAPCMPEILSITQNNSSSSVTITWSSANTAANYTANLIGAGTSHSCQSSGTSCEVHSLPCGSVYEVSAIASTAAGLSMPSYTVPLETGPCCPASLTVSQVTQAMSNVTWSAARGAQSYVTSLSSPRGDARCHTLDTHCLMGCITCGTNYTVSLEAISRTGHKSECTYHGFSSSECCPSGVRLYRMSNNTLRVHWRSSGSLLNHTADVYGSVSNYTCSPPPGANTCDVSEIVCGDVYTVVVSPIGRDGTKIQFCPRRMYSVSCAGNNVGMVIYRGRRSVD
ncbi:fibronectin type III domain-containing protein 7 [Chanos chanos]|uniref:Fibronectin type III domain-containing protein 7 n=1 Tax=Chanos chanos TaxID=29144 RepID=A0A6J2WIR6_CHACN|nr:fibronectin type III domain-containing protein 7 [Chanos chanos]